MVAKVERTTRRFRARFIKVEGLYASLWIGSGLWALAFDGIATSPAYAVLARNGGQLWAWAWLAIGLIQLAACYLDWLPLRVGVAIFSFLSFGLVAYGIGLVDIRRQGVVLFGTMAIFGLLVLGNPPLSDEVEAPRAE